MLSSFWGHVALLRPRKADLTGRSRSQTLQISTGENRATHSLRITQAVWTELAPRNADGSVNGLLTISRLIITNSDGKGSIRQAVPLRSVEIWKHVVGGASTEQLIHIGGFCCYDFFHSSIPIEP